ncbi:MAG TPA: haloacid dehalogenase [Chloroflexi bacterium]|nr:haloacid dehalogenase [Chloroflexota bacterium]
MEKLDAIPERIRADFEARNQARDEALRRSRELIRLCATAIRASHRDDTAGIADGDTGNDWTDAQALLAQADAVADDMRATVADYPDLLYAGYTQDALKELVEAHATIALTKGDPLPEPEALTVSYPAYLNGLCEAASEMRRRCLDEMRRGDTDEAERLLGVMDGIYDVLMTFDFPDAITGGLRRRVDQLRGVLERTRGDLTNTLRQDRLIRALNDFESRVGGD